MDVDVNEKPRTEDKLMVTMVDIDTELKFAVHNAIVAAYAFEDTSDPEQIAGLMTEELRARYGPDRVFLAVQQMVGMEMPELSRKYTQLGQQFRNQYFEGRIPEFTVHVHYGLPSGAVSMYCLFEPKILLRVGAEPHMVSRLLNVMTQVVCTKEIRAKAEAEPYADEADVNSEAKWERLYDEAMLEEHFRIRGAGAPMFMPNYLGYPWSVKHAELRETGDGWEWYNPKPRPDEATRASIYRRFNESYCLQHT